jgi:uncharacterized protein (DUF1015 family)
LATILPFRALRPAPELADLISAPLLDASNKETSWQLMQANPISYLHVVKPHLHFPGEKKDPDKHFPKGMEYLKKFIQDNVLVRDENPCFYVYQCIKGSRSYTGIIGSAAVDEYTNNTILKHENTRTDKQSELLQHISFFKNIGCPVLLTYPDSDLIEGLIDEITRQKPDYNFISDDSLKHNLWIINHPETLKLITDDFIRFDKLYIADGHHRSAGAAAYCDEQRKLNPSYNGSEYFNYFPVCLIPFSKLHIYEYHRLIKDDTIVNSPGFIGQVESFFHVKPCGHLPYQPLKKMQFGLYFNHHAYELTLKEEYVKGLTGTLEKLDVSIVEEFLIKRIFNITDSKTDERLSFLDGSKGIKQLQQAVDSGEQSIAITLFPTSVEEVKSVAEQHLIMPPKSTWIEPKMRTGLLIYTED